MASDDYDIVIEAMLEAPYQGQETEAKPSPPCPAQLGKGLEKIVASRQPTGSKKGCFFVFEEEISNKEIKERESRSRSEKNGSHSSSSSSRKSRTLSRDRRRSRSRSRERHRRRSSRHRSHERRYRSRSGGRRYRSRSRDRSHRRERSRHYSPGRRYTRSRSRSPRHKEKSPLRGPEPNLTPEERDARTVFCMQLAARIRPRDLEDFFSAVGKVRDVRIISDRNSRRSKGIAYVEFVDIQSVPLAIGLTGQRLLGVPIIVQASQAEKNRLAAMASNLQRGNTGPMRLYVGALHFNITEEMLRGIFEPFGKIEHIQLLREPDTGRSKGYGFITFVDAECARRALEQLNGFELAGRPMKVGLVTDRADGNTDASFLDNDDLERSGIDLGATGRLQLMAKLAEGTGLQIPLAAQAALQLNGVIPLTALNPALSALNPALSLASQLPISQLPLSQLFNLQSM